MQDTCNVECQLADIDEFNLCGHRGNQMATPKDDVLKQPINTKLSFDFKTTVFKSLQM